MPIPKQPPPKQDAATKLLDINGKLHEVMATLEVEKVVDEGIAVIPSAPIKASFTLASQAIQIASDVSQHGELLDSVVKLRDVLQKVLDTYDDTDGKITLPAEVAADLSMVIINFLANKIHDIAMGLIGATGQIQACSTSKTDPEEAATIAKYCSGVLPQISNATVTKVPLKHITLSGQKVVQHYPTNILHQLGLHKVEVSTHTAGENPLVAIEYHDSSASYADSKTRLKGVTERLEKEGLLCFPQYPNLYCSGEWDKDKLTQLATFFSLLLNADIAHMGQDTIPVVSDATWDYAGNLVMKHGDNTWKSGHGQVSWGAMHNKWAQDKEILEKAKIYGDLKQLAIYRDKHHELEEALGVDTHTTAGKKAITDIAKNGEEAVALIEKNSWGGNSIGHLQAQIKQFKASGSGGTSDAIGNIIHNILIDALQKLGQYGNCPTMLPLADVNAGALSYCEGTLKGTTTHLEGGGSMPMHKVAPKQYKSIIIDENPKGGYDIHIPIDKGFWSQELAAYLAVKFDFNCKSQSYGSWKAGSVCNVHIDTHDKIRLLAIFLSNLKGGSDAIGEECVPIAMQEAWNYAQEQAKKGTMAFTQEPIVENQKQWVDKCFKTYGIMPPGLTNEQKELLKIIGPDKIYAGCDLSAEEIVPNMGIITYCEGVRTNPQAVINAHLSEQGYLQHFFHSTTDKLADVFISPLEDGQYAVEVKNIDMRDQNLTKDVITLLKAANYDCQGNMCQKEMGEKDIRRLAMLLSSLHQAYKLPAAQMAPAITLAVSKIEAIPNDKKAYESMVYPYTEQDWVKELGKAPATAKKGKAPTLEPDTGFIWYKPFESVALPKAGYKLTLPKVHIVKLIEQGWSKEQLMQQLMNKEAWVDILAAALTPEQAEAVIEEYYPAEKVTVPPGQIKGVLQHPMPAGKSYPKLTWGYIQKLPNTGKPPWELGGCVSYVSAGPTKIKKGYCAGVVTEALDSEGNEIPLYEMEVAKLTTKENTHHIVGNGDIIFNSKWNSLYITLPDELAKIPEIKIALEKNLKFIFHGGSSWHKSASAASAARVAAFFSYLHNITKLPEECWGDAVLHALKQIGIDAPLLPVFPFKVKDWMNYVCKIEAPAEEPLIPKSVQPIDELITKSQAEWNALGKKLTSTPGLLEKAMEATAYKKLPKLAKDVIHAYLNTKLLMAHKAQVPYDKMLAIVQGEVTASYPGLTPLMVKLQLDIEKKSKIRKGELPEEPGEKVEKTLEQDSSAELKNSIMNHLKADYDEGTTDLSQLKEGVINQFGLDHSPYLNNFIEGWLTGYQQEIDKSNEPVVWLKLPADMKVLLDQAITEKAGEGKDVDTIEQEIMEQFNVKKYYKWQEKVRKEVAAYQDLIAKSKVPSHDWKDLPPSEKKNYILEAYEWAKDNPDYYDKDQIVALFESKYGFEPTKDINTVATWVVATAKALKAGELDKEKYTEPWKTGATYGNVPIEIVACMGEALNTLNPDTTSTGMFIPLMGSPPPAFKKKDIEEYWKNCVEQYEHDQQKSGGMIPHKYAELPPDQQQVIKEHMASLIDQAWGKIETIKQVRSMFYLELKGLPELWNELSMEKAEKSIEEGIPTIEEFMEAEPDSAKEAEKLALYLMGQNKWSINEISKAIAGKFAIKDDESLQKWIQKVKDHHGLKTMLGPKFEELSEGKKFEIITYIVEQADYPDEEIVSFVYGTHGVMESDALWGQIGKIKEGKEEAESEAAGTAEIAGEILFADISDELKEELKDTVKQQLKEGIISTEEIAGTLYNLYHVADYEYDMWDWINEVKEEVKAEKEPVTPTSWPPLYMDIAKQKADQFFTPEDMQNWISQSGYDKPDIEVVKKVLADLTQGGHLIWSIFENKYQYNADFGPDEEKLDVIPPGKLKQILMDILNEFPYELGTEIVVSKLSDKIAGSFLKPVIAQIIIALNELLAAGQIAMPEAGVWLTLSDMKGWANLPTEKKQEIINFIKLKSNLPESKLYPLIHQAYGVDANTLPSLALLYEASKKEEKLLPVMPKDELIQWVQSYLVSHPDIKFVAQEVHEALESHPDWESPGISPVGDTLIKLAKAGQLQSEQLDKQGPIYFWYGEKEAEELHLIDEESEEAKQNILNWAIMKAEGSLGDWADQVSAEFELVNNTALEDFLKPTWVETEGTAKEEPISYEALTGETKHDINLAVEGLLKSSTGPADIFQTIVNNYSLADDAPTNSWLNKLIDWHAEQVKEPEAPSPSKEKVTVFDPPNKPGYVEMAKKDIIEQHLAGKFLPAIITDNYGAHFEALKLSLPYFETWVNQVIAEYESGETTEKPLEQVEAAVKAMQLLGVGEFIGGCRITEPMDKLNPQNVSYCQGVLEKGAKLVNEGKDILHNQENQSVHVATSEGNHGEETNTWGTEIKILDPSTNKLVGIAELLNNILDECSVTPGKVTCLIGGEDSGSLSIADQDRLRKTALFLSSVDKVSELKDECVPYALKYAMESAKKKNETSQPWTTIPFPNEVSDWNTIVCSKIMA